MCIKELQATGKIVVMGKVVIYNDQRVTKASFEQLKTRMQNYMNNTKQGG